MPITPYHFGPGLLLGTAIDHSLPAFLAVNILIDIESGYHLVTHQVPVHTFFHTLVGATLAATIILIAVAATHAWRHPLSRRAITGIAVGAFAGAWSHVALDAIMHADVAPLSPWSPANPLLGIVPLTALHAACVASGILAIAVLTLRRRRGHA